MSSLSADVPVRGPEGMSLQIPWYLNFWTSMLVSRKATNDSSRTRRPCWTSSTCQRVNILMSTTDHYRNQCTLCSISITTPKSRGHRQASRQHTVKVLWTFETRGDHCCTTDRPNHWFPFRIQKLCSCHMDNRYTFSFG